MSLVRVESVSLTYGDVNAVSDISLSVEKSEFLGILGPSGSGKSSLLYMMSGLKNPTSGSVYFGENDLSKMSDSKRSNMRLKRFGFVFQQPYLLGYLSAIENILAISPNSEARANELLTELGLGGKSGRLPHQLSGGERQRLCVARALINNPDVIFADEPTASLDGKNGHLVVELLRKH